MKISRKRLQEIVKCEIKRQLKEARQYPDTAEEYAQDLNNQSSGSGFKLTTDPEHWASMDVYTGEDLARYLAIQDHYDSYKEVNGFRPRGMNYDKFSIEEIEAMTNSLYDDMSFDDV